MCVGVKVRGADPGPQPHTLGAVFEGLRSSCCACEVGDGPPDSVCGAEAAALGAPPGRLCTDASGGPEDRLHPPRPPSVLPRYSARRFGGSAHTQGRWRCLASR